MRALREEFQMEDDVTRLEPRVAAIEGEVAQLDSRFAGVEVDLRDLRKSMDRKLDKLDAKLDVRFERQDAKLATVLDHLSARFKIQDERFERQDTKQTILLEKLDARFERQDERFERRDAKLETAVDAKFDKMDTKIERMDAKFESKLEAMSTRRFAVWLAVMLIGGDDCGGRSGHYVRQTARTPVCLGLELERNGIRCPVPGIHSLRWMNPAPDSRIDAAGSPPTSGHCRRYRVWPWAREHRAFCAERLPQRFGEESLQLRRSSRSCMTFLDQRVPIVGRVPGGEHLGKDTIRVVLGAVGTPGVFIVHPAQRDDLTLYMEPKEQPILHEEFCPKRVFVFRTKCVALSEFGRGGIARDVLEY